MTKTPIQRFEEAVDTAHAMPTPHRISMDILAFCGPDTGLRAATYEARIRGSASVDDDDTTTVGLTPVERLALAKLITDRNTPRSTKSEAKDLIRVSDAASQAMDAIATLNAVCIDEGQPDGWDDATRYALYLAERKCNRPEHRDIGHHCDGPSIASTALGMADIRDVVHGGINDYRRGINNLVSVCALYNPRDANPWLVFKQNGGNIDSLCDVHASLTPPVFRDRYRKKSTLCRQCHELAPIVGRDRLRSVIESYETESQLTYRKKLQHAKDAWEAEQREECA